MSAVDAIHRYYELVDDGAIDDLIPLFADDIIYERPGHPPIAGIDAFRTFYEEDRPIGDGHHIIEQTYVDGATVIIRGRFEGTLAGDAVEFGFVDIHHCNADGEIDHRWTFTDLATV